jgi:acetylglutamate kinase
MTTAKNGNHRKILIKVGGRAFVDQAGFAELAGAIRMIPDTGVIIVHGGGAEISKALKAAGRKTEFINGIRVTQAEDILIVEKVLSVDVNRRITGYLEAAGVNCERLSGKSDGLVTVTPLRTDGCDYGFVGQVQRIDPQRINQALSAGKVPVISPISADHGGHTYNVNADSAAAALAAAAQCSDLVFFSDVPGVCVDDTPLDRIDMSTTRGLINRQVIKGGMIAKLEAAFNALNGGVARVHVAQWQGKNTLYTLLDEHPHKIGTTIVV